MRNQKSDKGGRVRSSARGMVGEITATWLIPLYNPISSQARYSFSALSIYCGNKYRGLWPYPGLLYIRLPYRAGPIQGVSYPTPSNNPADVSTDPPHVPVLFLASIRQLLQTLGLGRFYPHSNKISSLLVLLVV